jgi:hypothetical protein
MPVTPFHGGFGLLAKGCLGLRFSLISFCATQVVIDCESGYYLLRGEWPVHRLLHTIPGATLACTAVALAFYFVGARIDRRPTSTLTVMSLLRADLAAASSRSTAVMTIVGGVLGHLVPDGIMHSDVRPFAPLTDANPLYAIVSLATLHWSLIVMGIIGATLLVRNARNLVRIVPPKHLGS